MKGILRRALNNQSSRCHQRQFGLLTRYGQNRFVSRNLSVVSFDKTHARISLPINSKIIEKGLISQELLTIIHVVSLYIFVFVLKSSKISQQYGFDGIALVKSVSKRVVDKKFWIHLNGPKKLYWRVVLLKITNWNSQFTAKKITLEKYL